MRKFAAFFSICLLLFAFSCSQSPPVTEPVGGGGELNPGLKTNREALTRWQNLRFGMFVHWGPVSQMGTEIGWSRGKEIPISKYDSLYLTFNPEFFDAGEWIRIAKETGMKYFIITAKHHDGFCLWPTKYNDYNISNTPFHRDVLKELETACKDQGVLFGTYYSILDWKHPDYTTRHNDPRPVEGSDMSVYKKYLFNQVQELIRDYHTNILWFDGEWEASWTHEMGMELYKYCRDLNNQLLINNRVDKGFKSMKGMADSLSKYAGDFGTPEQRIGAFNQEVPWESCITVGTQWAWKPNDKLKSSKEIIHTLIKTVGGDGNLLLNVGPMPDGWIEPRQVELLHEVGDWMKINGEAVYGTSGGPYLPTGKLASTRKGHYIYLHVMDLTLKKVILPLPQGYKAVRVSVLGDKEISYDNRQRALLIRLPEMPVDQPAYVLKIRLNKPAWPIEPAAVNMTN
ncbi:MAG: alpha-L-fucosidase [Bacteroidales bacterium]|nr:alpha-L-fucosidase [Bacteroidales bacterium]